MDEEPKIVRTQEEIDKLIEWAEEGRNNSHYRAMSYEQGILAMYKWLIGEEDEDPT